MRTETTLVLLLAIAQVFAFVPTKPDAWASLPSPEFIWTFRQTDCAAGEVPEDVSNGVNFTIGTTVECPTRTEDGGTVYEKAVVGATNTDLAAENTGIMSGSIGTTLDSFTNDGAGPGAMERTLVWWFSPTATLTETHDHVVFEVGPATTGNSDVGPNAGDPQYSLMYRRVNGGADGFTHQFRFNQDSDGDDRRFNKGSVDCDSESGIATLEKLGDGTAIGELFILSHRLITTLPTPTSEVRLQLAGQPDYVCVNEQGGNAVFADVRQYIWRSTDVMRIGTKAALASDRFTMQADFHHLAMYNSALSAVELASLMTAGLANSVPVVQLATPHDGFFQVLAEDDNVSPINMSASLSFFDADGDVPAFFEIVAVPDASDGTLYLDGTTPITAGSFIPASSTVTFSQNVPDAFSENDADCSTLTSPDSAFATFTYRASDGLGDGSATCTAGSNDATCMSPDVGTFQICVMEANDAPVVVGGEETKLQQANQLKFEAFEVQCQDKDANLAAFGMTKIRIINHTRIDGGSSLGNIIGQDNVTVVNDLDEFPLSGGAPNDVLSYAFSYQTLEVTNVTTTLIGVMRIYYACIDAADAETESYVDIDVRNALLAGCAAPDYPASQVKDGGNPLLSSPLVESQNGEFTFNCLTYGSEDEEFNLTLSGLDGVASHTNEFRYFRVDSLPMWNGIQVGELYLNATTPVEVGDIFPAESSTGNLILLYVPPVNWFNSLCDLNKDPSLPYATNCPSPVYQDGLAVQFHSCSDAAGCPVTFTFTMGYDEGGLGDEDDIVWGPTLEDGYQIFVMGVNDNAGGDISIIGPDYAFLENSGEAYLRTFIDDNNSTLTYTDPAGDGDTYRLGFELRVVTARAILSVPDTFDNPLVDGTNRRLTLISGDECLETGDSNCVFLAKAYLSDMQRFINQVFVSTTSSNRNDTIRFRVFDPVVAPQNFDKGSSNIPGDSIPDAERNITLQIGTGSSGSGPSPFVFTVGIYAGIAAGSLFVLLACLACISACFRRARRGEQAAVWFVRNLLFSDVEHKQHPDLQSAVAGGRSSLAHAVKAEHDRLAEVAVCAKCLRCFGCLKFDDNDLNVPDEETLMKEVLVEEEHKMALKHKPAEELRDVQISEQKMKSRDVEDGVVEDIVADDDIFDWERHIDDTTGKVFYYNVKTQESRWTPPTVKVHEQKKIADRTSKDVKQLYTPQPPTQPKPKAADDSEADRVRKN